MGVTDFVDDFTRLNTELSEWSQKTFGSDDERGPIGALKHLAKEAKEAAEAVDRGELLKELADCLILTLDATRRGKFTASDLLQAALEKMEVNRNRKWPAPVKDEPVEHVRDGEGVSFEIKELRDEDGNVIHACAVGSFPLPEDHWIYSRIILTPKPIPTEIGAMRQRLKECLRWAIQVCTDGGKDSDFDPDAMCMAVDGAFFASESIPVVEEEPDAFCLSADGENYDSRFPTEQEAIDEAVAWGCEVFYIGKPEKPSQPEEFWFVDEWISHVSEQDDYGGEYAEGWYCGNREQEKELEEQVRPVLAAWLDRHKLRPKHWLINSSTKYIVVEGQVMTEAELNGMEE